LDDVGNGDSFDHDVDQRVAIEYGRRQPLCLWRLAGSGGSSIARR
jgi:hypothetical protein